MRVNGRAFFLAFIIIFEAWLVFVDHDEPDLSIWGNQYKPPNFPTLPYFATYNPEGVLWTWLNPVGSMNPYQYELFTAGIAWALLAIQLILVRKGKLPLNLVAFSQLMGFIWFFGWGHEMQNVTISAIMPFMYFIPELGILSIIQKLPIGWFPISFSEPHWGCLLHCAISQNTTDLFILEAFRFSNYAVLMIMFLAPIWARWSEGKSWLYIMPKFRPKDKPPFSLETLAILIFCTYGVLVIVMAILTGSFLIR